MYFSTAVALAALPFLVGASPVQNSLRDLISIPLSKRSTFKNADGVANTASLKANIHRSVAKIHQGFKRFEINTGQTHPLAPKEGKGHKRRDAVPLTDVNRGMMWTGEIAVGTPPKTFTIDFDTGSSDLFLPGDSCSNCGTRNIYNPPENSTSKDLRKNFNITYSDGSAATGDLFMDTVAVGGFKVTNQTLGAASSLVHFGTLEADGILGLGFKSVSAFNADPFFTNLNRIQKSSDSHFRPVFGVVLAENNSELIIGGTDTSRFHGDLTYITVDTPGFWQTQLDGITIDENDIQVENKHVIIDTGTTLILGDFEDIARIYTYIPGSAQLENSAVWTIPCNANADIKINFGGVGFNISPKTYILHSASSEMCIGGFQATGEKNWIIGDVFLQNVYTEFDFGKLQVGFAALA